MGQIVLRFIRTNDQHYIQSGFLFWRTK